MKEMLDIKIRELIVPKEFVKYLSIAWNGDIEIHLSDPTKGEHQEKFEKWGNWCGRHDKETIEDLVIGGHEFNEDRFRFSCDVDPVIPNKTGGKIQIVLIPRNGKALEIGIENLIIPKEFVKIIKFRENKIQIRIEQPDTDSDNHKMLEELIAMSGFYDNKVIDTIKLGSYLWKNQKFTFTSNPHRGIAGIKPGSLEITLM